MRADRRSAIEQWSLDIDQALRNETRIGLEVIRSGDLRGSISEYFYSPVRSIFVGSLLVIGFSLVAIHVRHRWEETFLTLGGMLAIIVALIPTGQRNGLAYVLMGCGQVAIQQMGCTQLHP